MSVFKAWSSVFELESRDVDRQNLDLTNFSFRPQGRGDVFVDEEPLRSVELPYAHNQLGDSKQSLTRQRHLDAFDGLRHE